ncbi:MAG: hypothetical protein QM813_21980 [Verrucomicrobiota bacterium]
MMTNEIQELKVRVKGPDLQNIEAQLERLTWHAAVLRIFDTNAVVRVSQVFTELTVEANGIALYSGKAVVGSVIDTGASLVCAVKLSEGGFRSMESISGNDRARCDAGFSGVSERLGKVLSHSARV